MGFGPWAMDGWPLVYVYGDSWSRAGCNYSGGLQGEVHPWSWPVLRWSKDAQKRKSELRPKMPLKQNGFWNRMWADGEMGWSWGWIRGPETVAVLRTCMLSWNYWILLHGPLRVCYVPGSSRLWFRPSKFKAPSSMCLPVTVTIILTIFITELE